MSIFGSIMSKIFHHGGAGVSGGSPAAPKTQTASSTPAASPGGGSTAAAPMGGQSASASSPAQTGSTGGSGGSQPVDVEAVLTGLASKAGQPLDWRRSIVDLMKLLNLDSSLTARKELAAELHYTGDTNDSATMNVWLHKQVMQKLAENGGKVPAELRG
jgi:hypothetical protein